ncbi:sporulation histidine kinase inhibitor Sda [Jeotgalibacillus sp. JSM ZJ347]
MGHLSNEKLLEALESAKKLNLTKDFIQLLEREVEKRGLRALMCS